MRYNDHIPPTAGGGRAEFAGDRGLMKTSLRIVAGTLRGRKIDCDVTPDLRPTSQRAREALFSILGGYLDGFRFVDVFAGTGVIGIEALSRGATRCLFVEKDARLVSNIEKHLARFGVGLRSDILKVDAYRWAEQFLAPQEPTLVFISPPFPDFEARPDDLHKLVENLTKALVPGSILVLQAEEHDNLPRVATGEDWDVRRYGRNQLWIRRIPGLEDESEEETPSDAAGDGTEGNSEEI